MAWKKLPDRVNLGSATRRIILCLPPWTGVKISVVCTMNARYYGGKLGKRVRKVPKKIIKNIKGTDHGGKKD
jgi:hypothetical protein